MRSRPFSPPKAIVVALAACFCTAAGAQLPSGGEQAGVFKATTNGNTMTFRTFVDRAFINQQKFSIGAGYRVDVIQPMVSSAALFNVLGPDPSQLLGTLTSNGSVFLINPAGIYVGPNAHINTAQFVASTLRLSEADFLAKRLRFSASPGAGTVRNDGAITVADGGSVYLVAPDVENHGIITAPNGEILLAAGKSVELVNTATPGVRVEITADAGQALNVGKLLAESGRVGLAGAVVRNSGMINASSAVRDGGRVFLKATQRVEVDAAGRILAGGSRGGEVTLESGDTTLVAGRIDVTGSAGSGGRAELLGDKVGLIGDAVIDASGATGGGTVLVGGDFQGKNPDIRNARVSFVGAGTRIKADATDDGDGGKVVVWADDTTYAYGDISARGGANGGDGGFVEASGKGHLDFHARVDTRAAKGRAGTLLLDPMDITVVSGTAAYGGGDFAYGGSAGIFGSSSGEGSSTIGWDTIESQLATTNVMITTTSSAAYAGNITIAGSPSGGGSFSIAHSGGPTNYSNTYSGNTYNSSNKLGFFAHGDIDINASFGNAGSGALEFVAGWNGSLSSPAVGSTGAINLNDAVVASKGAQTWRAGQLIHVNAVGQSAGIDIDGGALTMSANKIELTGGVNNGAGAFVATNGDQSFTLTGTAAYGGLYLTAGSAARGSSAQISRFGGSSAGQRFVVGSAAYGADVVLTAGNGIGEPIVAAGGGGGATPGCVYGGPVCANNFAMIQNHGAGGQHFDFRNLGRLVLLGGGVGNGNFASIDNRNGLLKIHSSTGFSPDIEITGGASGGAFYGGEFIGNQADLASEGSLEIVARDITLDGGGADYGGAFIGSPSVKIQADNLTLVGGSGGVVDSSLGPVGIPGSGAIIGWDAPATIDIDVAGSVAIDGGTGSGGGAMIGTAPANGGAATTVKIKAGNDIAVTGGYGGVFIGATAGNADVTLDAGDNVSLAGGSGGVLIGSPAGAGGTVTIVSGAGIALGDALIKTGAGGSVDLETGDGSVVQDADGAIVTGNLSAAAYGYFGGGDVHLPGQNVASHVDLGAGGKYGSANIVFNSAAALAHVNAHGSGDITLSAYNAGGETHGDLALGSIVSDHGYAHVNVSARRILDDNGSGVSNIHGYRVDLTAYGGGAASDLSISTDVTMRPGEGGSRLTATVASTNAGYGGVRVFNVGSVEPEVDLGDHSAYGGAMHYKAAGSVDIGSSHFFAAKGDLLVEAPGAESDIYVSGTLSIHGGITLVAGHDVETGGGATIETFGSQHDILLTAGHDVLLGGSDVVLADDGRVLIAAGNQVQLGAGAEILAYGTTAGHRDVGISADSVLIEGYIDSGDGAVSILGSTSVTVDHGHIDGERGVAIAGGSVAVKNSGAVHAFNGDVAIAAGAIDITSGSQVKAYDGNVGLSAGGDINIRGAHVAAYGVGPAAGNVVAAAGGDLHLSYGGSIVASNDVFLTLTGADSKLILNDLDDVNGEASPARIISKVGYGVGDTTFVDLPVRASGGVIIDGVETTTTNPGGSGIFVNDSATPAALGGGLVITYGSTNPVLPLIETAIGDMNGTHDRDRPPPPPDSTEGQNNEFSEKPGQCT